ncbi:hypothetical protein [Ralstonia insidiosa]|uniref:G domain-containing protein n=1 Tax=Ralstonia insidiosa TaxID=190721 RepID=A0A848NX79_9RALS|nr:hypothetical protein [Ralstonia insidiosa]NMV37870.1 hypothetical protein [Ralstonia insidiosa]
MSTVANLDELFDEATGTARREELRVPVRQALAPVHASTKNLDRLLNEQLPALVRSAATLERYRLHALRVDGCIIGTGEADFTKGNTAYTLRYRGKTFQLLDVPGIEGDEGKYASIVNEAIAKAHLVIYVNGTNKKPEKATAEKIRSYLRWGTQVYPLVNVRGNADAYEFEEDRESLELHGDAKSALQQTAGVLEAVLPEGVLLPGSCVQGLLAFSSLAMDAKSGTTTIHPSRDKDLVIQQRNYRKHFATYKAMFAFSQIGAIANVVDARLPSFKEDIIESNKVKVRELLSWNIDELQAARASHQKFMADVAPSFSDCRDLIGDSLSTLERLLLTGRSNLWSGFFNRFSERADEIVARHYGENEVIALELKKTFKSLQSELDEKLQSHLEELLQSLQSDTREAMQRLIVDVQRVQLQQRMAFDPRNRTVAYSVTPLDTNLGLEEWRSIAFNIGSYAFTGAGIGSAFPVIGTMIGAVAGAVVGVLVSAVELFTSKEKRIRKAQAQVQDKIDDMRMAVNHRLREEVGETFRTVSEEVRTTTLAWVDSIHAGLARPLGVIEQQIAVMSNIKDQLERMPHGTIQTIQR